MKVLLMISLITMSLTASAFEFKTGNVVLPEQVKERIHAKLEEHCSSDVNYVGSLNLIESNVTTIRIDQGYKENQYRLKFKVVYVNTPYPRNDIFEVRVVDQLEDRSGELQTYVLDYQTTACN